MNLRNKIIAAFICFATILSMSIGGISNVIAQKDYLDSVISVGYVDYDKNGKEIGRDSKDIYSHIYEENDEFEDSDEYTKRAEMKGFTFDENTNTLTIDDVHNHQNMTLYIKSYAPDKKEKVNIYLKGTNVFANIWLENVSVKVDGDRKSILTSGYKEYVNDFNDYEEYAYEEPLDLDNSYLDVSKNVNFNLYTLGKYGRLIVSNNSHEKNLKDIVKLEADPEATDKEGFVTYSSNVNFGILSKIKSIYTFKDHPNDEVEDESEGLGHTCYVGECTSKNGKNQYYILMPSELSDNYYVLTRSYDSLDEFLDDHSQYSLQKNDKAKDKYLIKMVVGNALYKDGNGEEYEEAELYDGGAVARDDEDEYEYGYYKIHSTKLGGKNSSYIDYTEPSASKDELEAVPNDDGYVDYYHTLRKVNSNRLEVDSIYGGNEHAPVDTDYSRVRAPGVLA